MAEAKLDITDELLVAYVDDELDPAHRELVSSILESSPSARRRAEEMRLSRDLLRKAFPLRADASVPRSIETAANRLAEAFERKGSASHATASPRLLPPAQPKARPSRPPRWRKFTLAAAVVLSVAVPASYLAWRAGAKSAIEGPATALLQIDPGTSLYRALQSTPSGQLVNESGNDAAARAVLTFLAKDGRFCREFEVLADAESTAGIACRDQEGWRAEVMLSSQVAAPDLTHYTPASASDEPALAEVADRLMQGDALSIEEEARILASGWKASSSPSASESSDTP